MYKGLKYQIHHWQVKSIVVLFVLLLLAKTSYYYYQQQHPQKLQHLAHLAPNNIQSLAISAFNPNDLSQESWQKLGFSPKQAASILKYKQICGGSFSSQAQLAKCYMISPEKMALLAPYILLPKGEANANSDKDKINKLAKVVLKKFNPNDLSQEAWQKLGFSPKQAASILKYKQICGGSFSSQAQLAKCYMISPEKMALLAPYILLPKEEAVKPKTSYIIAQKQIVLKDFDPNDLSQEAWQQLGFSPKQAAGILNYKNKILKGRFAHASDLEKCYMISAEKYAELQKYIKIIPPMMVQAETSPSPKLNTEINAKQDLNNIGFEALKNLGLDDKTAASFLGFRKALGGYANSSQLYKIYGISPELAQKLAQECVISRKNKRVNIKTIDEEWLRKHPYFRKLADKIIALRPEYSSSLEIIEALKVNDSDKQQMLWYVE